MLEHRSQDVEIMDDLSITGEVIPVTLRELDRINQLLGGNAISLGAFKKMVTENVTSVADLGCGSGDILMRMHALAQHEINFVGVDANPSITAYASAHTQAYHNITIESLDILSPSFQEKSFDIIHCCLFLHHFSGEVLISLFKSFSRQARRGFIVNDLHRHPLAYYSIKWLTALFSKSYMVKSDAATSVSRGFKRAELLYILKEANLTNFTLKWRWAFRWELIVYTS